MDQLKDFLKQCVKYRFWIAVGISLLLPMIGYFVGVGPMVEATTKREVEIKGVSTEVAKYKNPGVINADYQPVAAQKKDALTQDVDASWRKLFASQEPLLKWPEEVEARFRQWGRKYPADVDKGQVTTTLIDYATVYPAFLEKVYKTFKPFNFDDGSGIVVAPDEKALLNAPAFSPDNPPELGKVWAEQERIWVVTALLDVVAKVNDSVGAKDWDGAIVKQINLIEVGAQGDQDQVSIIKGETLEPADVLNPDGTTAPPATTTASTTPGPGSVPSGMPGMGNAATGELYYIKTEGKQYKTLPIKMTVLVEQSKLPDFLIGLENSPMTIQVKEAEISKPLTPVIKPVYGERQAFGRMGMGGPGMGPGEMNMMGPGGPNSSMMRSMGRGNEMSGPGMMQGRMGGMNDMRAMGGGTSKEPKKGVDNRSAPNKAAERKNASKDAGKPKQEAKSKVDVYYNVIEVTVYGQARFYLAPPPLPDAPPSAGAPQPSTAPKAEEPKPADALKVGEPPAKEETPKAEATTPKTDEPKADAPKADSSKGGSPPSKP